METQKRLLTPEEEAAERKRKQLAILKASNQLLAECGEKVMATDKIGDLERTQRMREITNAQKENVTAARTYLQASEKEMNNVEMSKPSKEYEEKYKKRIQQRGYSEDMIERKEQATVSYGKEEEKKTTRTRRKKEEKELGIVRVANEEELMKQSRADTDEKVDNAIRQKKSEDTPKNRERTAEENLKMLAKAVTPQTTESAPIAENPTEEEQKQLTFDTEFVSASQYDFDFDSIPKNVQYDIIPLPSNGECYPHKKSRIPVAYLTAADENLIASPNMYRDGKIIDVILKRKILDKSFSVDSLCRGDRDAIVLFLRSTGYGNDFPVIVTNPDNGKRYDVNADLSSFKYRPFNLKGDENGYFPYTYKKNTILFKFLSANEEDELRETIVRQETDTSVYDIVKYTGLIRASANADNLFTQSMRDDINECVDDIMSALGDVGDIAKDSETAYSSSITEQMIAYTMAVNGNTDREYIRDFIENMRAGDAREYRTYVSKNRPGVDFSMKVNIPESDGGGSFTTFLRLDNTAFINL